MGCNNTSIKQEGVPWTLIKTGRHLWPVTMVTDAGEGFWGDCVDVWRADKHFAAGGLFLE